jgi:hypothetical protein
MDKEAGEVSAASSLILCLKLDAALAYAEHYKGTAETGNGQLFCQQPKALTWE